MRLHSRKLALLAFAISILATLAWWGPIPQFAEYHQFADHSTWGPIPHAADVLSNALFLLPCFAGMRTVLRRWPQEVGRNGYMLFFASLGLTALGSGWYHLAPDNASLVWDRLPIALACAGILDAVIAEQCGARDAQQLRPILWAWAPLSVLWWYWRELNGIGDLRPYLFLQGLPLVMIPLLLILFPSNRSYRTGLGVAILAYVMAKVFELTDHPVLEMTGWISGHTLKHVFAAIAGMTVVWMLHQRNEKAPQSSGASGQT